MLERSNVIPGPFPDQGEASQGGGVTYGLLHLPALRFFVVLLVLISEGLLQNDKNRYFRENLKSVSANNDRTIRFLLKFMKRIL
jgi:hypothetical protein